MVQHENEHNDEARFRACQSFSKEKGYEEHMRNA